MKLKSQAIGGGLIEIYINDRYETTIKDDEVIGAGNGQIPIESPKGKLLGLFGDLQFFLDQQTKIHDDEIY